MKPSKQPNQSTLHLLNEFKHKRFTSELLSHQYPADYVSQPILNPSSSSGYGFICSYHPTEFVTNICVSHQQSPAKPLCPRCLQQHMKSHPLKSDSISCRLEPCDTEIHSISLSLTQKLSSCHKLKQTVSHLNKWQTVQLSEIHQNLTQFKSSLLTQIEKEFTSIQKEIQTKWERHIKEYNETIKRLSQMMGNLEQHCERSLKLITDKKQIDSICSSFLQIGKKYHDLIKFEQKMLNCASSKLQGKFNVNNITQIISSVKSSLEIKVNKVNGFEIDRLLKEYEQKPFKIQQIQDHSTLSKLQKFFQSNSKNKLHTLTENESHQPNITQTLKLATLAQNVDERVLNKLNDTTNKLKTSLNTFTKGNKQKIHV